MICLAQNMQLLAQREDFDNWVNIFVVVMLAVFWLVGGLVKAMSKKAQDQKLGTEAKPKPSGLSKDFRKPRLQKPPPVPSGVGPPSQPQLLRQFKEGARPRPVAHKPAVDLALQSDYLSKAQFIEQPDISKAPTLMQKPRSEAASLPFLDLSNPQELRKAIIYYEILGKPLALRGPHSPPW